jgi:hypothetical protein
MLRRREKSLVPSIERSPDRRSSLYRVRQSSLMLIRNKIINSAQTVHVFYSLLRCACLLTRQAAVRIPWVKSKYQFPSTIEELITMLPLHGQNTTAIPQ